MKSKLSALLDGEAGENDVSAVCEALRHRPGLRDDAMAYALIGACLRGETGANQGMAHRVMAVVAAEPVVMASRRPLWKSGGFALVASVAGAVVLVAAVVAPSKNIPEPGYTLAHTSNLLLQSRVLAANDVGGDRLKDADVREYLIAHEAQSRGSYVGGGSQQIRTVSLLDEGAGR
jgi:hypothetical protein